MIWGSGHVAGSSEEQSSRYTQVCEAAHHTHWYLAWACLHRLQSSFPTEQLYSTTVGETGEVRDGGEEEVGVTQTELEIREGGRNSRTAAATHTPVRVLSIFLSVCLSLIWNDTFTSCCLS